MQIKQGKPKRLFIVSGDHSGQLHASHVVDALKRLDANVEIGGIGGSAMQRAGVKLLADQSRMGRMGAGALTGAPYHIMLGWQILKHLKEFKPDGILLIDYGGFNMNLARFLKAEGYKVYYYITPQVWASRLGRIKKIKQYIDHIFCIFPFEDALYTACEIPHTFVGHPLMSQLPPKTDRQVFCNRYNLKPEHKIVGIFPGSRKIETGNLFEPMLQAAAQLKEKDPNVQFVIAKSTALKDDYYAHTFDKALASQDILKREDLHLVEHDNHAILSASDAVMLASGTVTLEAAIYKTPMIIAYKGPALMYEIVLRVCYLPCIGLPNILTHMDDNFTEPLTFPEFHQYAVTADNISNAISQLLDPESTDYQSQHRAFDIIEQKLNASNKDLKPAAELVAKGLVELLACSVQREQGQKVSSVTANRL